MLRVFSVFCVWWDRTHKQTEELAMRIRQRKQGESVQEWLMSDQDRNNSKFGLSGSQVQCAAILNKEFDGKFNSVKRNTNKHQS